MRVAFVRQKYNPYGGAERFIERAAEVLQRDGTEITLVARDWKPGRARILKVDPFYVGRLWRDASFARAARAAWRNAGFDLVQSHERIPGCDLYRAGDGVHAQWLDYRLAGAPALERLALRASPYHRYVCAAERAMLEHPRLRAVICNSRMVRGEILKRFAVDENKLYVIYNGVDTEHFRPQPRPDAKQLRLLFVGSGFARKGLDTLLQALAKTDCGLTVVGRDREQARFAALAERVGVAHRVRFSGGVEDVRPFYADADLLVLPTRYDPFPNVALEALAMGVPALVSEQCGAAEIIGHGESGYVCRANDVEQIVGLLGDFASRREKGEMREKARRAVEPFSFEAMAGQLRALYASLAATI